MAGLKELGVVYMNESVQNQSSQEKFERRRKEAEELFYTHFIYLSTKDNLRFYHDKAKRNIVDKSEYSNAQLDVAANNFVLDLMIKDITFILEYLSNADLIRENSLAVIRQATKNDSGQEVFILPPLGDSKIPLNKTKITFNKGHSLPSYISDNIKETFQYEKNIDIKNTTFNYIDKALQLYELYKSTQSCFKNRYLYDEILRWYPTATVNQILTAAMIFKHSPWYNEWSFLTYYLQNDLDAISEIYNYFSPMDPEDERNFFRYFYDNRKILGQNVAKRKYDLIGNFIKSGWQPDNLIKNFSSDEQNLIKTWLQNPDIAEIATTENVIRNLLILNKTQGINPVEFIQKMKQDRLKNGAEKELTNSYIRRIFDADIIDVFSNELFKKFIPFDVKNLPQEQKEFFASAFISNAASCMSSAEWPIIPEDVLDQNLNLKNMFFVGNSAYLVPYQAGINSDLQNEIFDLIIKNFETIKQNISSLYNELCMDAITAYLQNAFGFKLENESYFYDNASATYKLTSLSDGAEVDKVINSFMPICFVQLNIIASLSLFEENPTLLAIRSLNDPENVFIKTNANQNFIDNFLKVFKTVDSNERHDKLVTLLSRINLNTPFAKGIMEDAGIAQQFQNLSVDVLNKKREYISNDHKNDFSDDFLALLPKKVCEQDEERLATLKNLSDNLDKVKNSISDPKQIETLLNAIIVSDKSIIDCVINLANAQKLEHISPDTLDYIANINDALDPVLSYLFSYTNPDLLCAIFEQTKNSFLIKTMLDKKINMCSENIKRIIALLNKNDFNSVFAYRNQLYNKYKKEIETEKEIRDILADINTICPSKPDDLKLEETQDSKIVASQVTNFVAQNALNNISQMRNNLYLFANSMYLNAMNKRNRGIPYEQNDSLYIFNQVRERLPEGLAKEIFTQVATQEYESAFRTKINSAKEQKQAVSLSQSFLSEQTL